MKFFVIALIISVLVFGFFVKPMWEKKITLESELLNLSDILLKKTALKEKLNELELKYNEAKDYEKNINLAIPDKPEEENLIAQLEAIGIQSGIAINNINLHKPNSNQTRESAYKELGLDLLIKGSLTGIENFLDLISQSMRIIEIQSLDLDSDVNGVNFTANIKGKTFYKN